MKTPTIHTNGSSATTLLDGYAAVLDALSKAQDYLASTGPNGRDYYPQGESAYAVARAEHEARIEKVRAVREEIETIASIVSDQVDLRRGARS